MPSLPILDDPSANAKEREQEIWNLYREHGTVEAVVDRIGIPRQAVSAVIDGMPLRQVYRRKGILPAYKKEILKKALKAAAEVCGEPLTIPAYRLEAPSHGWPADLTITKAFGSWGEACAAAGVTFNTPKGAQRGSYGRGDCVKALRLCKAELGDVPSYERYSVWARENRQPSGSTVRVKIGPWREALQAAFDSKQ